MSDENMSDADIISSQKQRIKELEMELNNYRNMVDDIIDDTLDNIDSKEEQTGSQKYDSNIDWKTIKQHLANKNDKYILSKINNNEIDFDKEYNPPKDDWGGKKYNIFTLAIQHGRIEIVKTIINLGKIITDADIDCARLAKEYEIIELLLLTKSGLGTANKLQTDCAIAWIEDATIKAFLEAIKGGNIPEQKLVTVIKTMIQNRKPISSWLLNVGMTLDSENIWKCVYKVMKDIIRNPSDTFGWKYLNKYLMNSTFLFRKYLLGNNDNDEKNEYQTRMVQDLNVEEVILYLAEKRKLCRKQMHQRYLNESDFSDSETEEFEEPLTDKDVKVLNIALRRENINGAKFSAMSAGQFSAFLRAAGIESRYRDFENPGSNGFTKYVKGSNIDKGRIPFNVPRIVVGEYGYDYVFKSAHYSSIQEARNDIGASYKKWIENSDQWTYILNYGTNIANKKRLRQDTLQNGLTSKYKKKDLIVRLGGQGSISFNPVKFYDYSIYLNQLMIECGIINDIFQSDVQTIFENLKGVSYRKGPLKKRERCVIKCEADYGSELFPTSACLLDIVRCTLTFQSIDDMINGIKHFEQAIESQKYCLKNILRIKNGFNESFAAKNVIMQYADIKYNVQIQCASAKDIIVEVQLLVKDMAKFKKKSHKFYGITRQNDYFQTLIQISDMKNNPLNRMNIAFQQFNHKQLTETCIDLNITSVEQMEKMFDPFVEEWLVATYEEGGEKAIKCLQVLMKLSNKTTYEFFSRIFPIPLRLGNALTTGLMLAVENNNLNLTKYILSSLDNDQERRKLIEIVNRPDRGQYYPWGTDYCNVRSDKFVGDKPEIKKYIESFYQ